jgi:spermidine synthase
VRTLYFGHIVESQVDLARPHRLMLSYYRAMFASLLFVPPPFDSSRRTLLIGLGGGAMVHFMNHVFPKMHLDVVELNPSVIRLAYDVFGLRPNVPTTRIVQADAFDFVRRAPSASYDVVMMDAFLHPTEGTDATGVPLHLKTNAFTRDLKRLLVPNGVAVFNLNDGPQTADDLANLRAVFPVTYTMVRGGNIIVVALSTRSIPTSETLSSRAMHVDRQLPQDAGFSFADLRRSLPLPHIHGDMIHPS